MKLRGPRALAAGVEDHLFPQVGTVTVSVGYTGINSSDTIPDIVGRADDALYFAKENGRNPGEVTTSACLPRARCRPVKPPTAISNCSDDARLPR
jgi:predicted signal transduction protein with EAL and GGDEF domain